MGQEGDGVWTELVIQEQPAMGQWFDSDHITMRVRLHPLDMKPPWCRSILRLCLGEFNGVGKSSPLNGFGMNVLVCSSLSCSKLAQVKRR